MTITSMVFVILLGATVFSLTFRGLGGENLVYGILADIPGGANGAILVVMLLVFVLGFFLDTFQIIFIVVPIAAPVLIQLGVDPIWLGVMIGVNLQTSFLTPPFGFALFYLRGAAKAVIKTADIYRGALPFVALQVIGLLLLWFFPSIATKLPDIIYRAEASPAAISAPANTNGDSTPKARPGSGDDFKDLFGTRNEQRVAPSDDFRDLFSDR